MSRSIRLTRSVIAAGVAALNKRLAADPLNEGESRYGRYRITFATSAGRLVPRQRSGPDRPGNDGHHGSAAAASPTAVTPARPGRAGPSPPTGRSPRRSSVVRRQPLPDLLLGRDGRAVVAAAEVLADLAVRRRRVLPGQVHRQHPRVAHRPRPASSTCNVPGRQPQHPHTAASTSANRHHPDRVPQQVAQRLAGQRHVDRPAGHPAVVPQAVQRPLQLADVAAQLRGQELQHARPGSAAPPPAAFARRMSSRVSASGGGRPHTAPPSRRSASSGVKSSASRG